MTLPETIRKVVGGANLTQEEAYTAVSFLMRGEATPAQIGALLVALRMKGETVEEVTGFAQGMREQVVPVTPTRTPLLDTCGTGGTPLRVFNVSTATAFVLASAGIAVAKHGNRAITGVCGSGDVLEALGVKINLTPAQCAECIDTVGLGFLFAPNHHPAMKHVGGPRREIGVRTIFNLLGPLSNPAGAKLQVMGVYDAALCSLAAGALWRLGSERALVVHGEGGLGEVSTFGPTRVSELRDGQITEYVLTPDDLGLVGPLPALEDLAPASTPAENAAYLREILSGQANAGPALSRRNLVAVNAAAALRVCGRADSWPDAVQQAQAQIASGQPLVTLEHLIQRTTAFSTGNS